MRGKSSWKATGILNQKKRKENEEEEKVSRDRRRKLVRSQETPRYQCPHCFFNLSSDRILLVFAVILMPEEKYHPESNGKEKAEILCGKKKWKKKDNNTAGQLYHLYCIFSCYFFRRSKEDQKESQVIKGRKGGEKILLHKSQPNHFFSLSSSLVLLSGKEGKEKRMGKRK